MRGRIGLTWRRRYLVTGLLALAGAMIFVVAGAFADAGNPILGTIKASAVNNGNGTITIYVRGQWNWLSHNNDCNDDRNGAGVGIIWNDPTEPGFTVTKAPISAQVGIASLRPGDTVNKIDQMVHPSDRGNVPEGYTVAGVDYPAGQQFVDPDPPGITAAQLAAWRGGCGRIPLTATASKGAHPERTGKTCANGTNDCSGHPWGSWGYEQNGGLGYAHTYLANQLPSKVCVNFYDVHGSNAGLQAPSGTKEINVDGDNGGNGDNSIQTNSFNVADGANCIALVVPTLTTVASNAEVGHPISDTATLTGVPAGAGGTLTFQAYGPRTAAPAPNCTNPPAFSSTVNVNGPGSYNSGNFTPTAPGRYDWKVSYSGDPANLVLGADLACGDTSGANREISTVVDANIQITPQTATNPLSTNHTLTGHVNVNDGTGFANAPNGTTISFSLTNANGASASFVGASSCTTSGGTGSCSVVINSSTTGTTTVKASTDVTVAGIALHRETGDANAGDSADATKHWAAAKITIAPSATNEVGQSHTFTIHIEANEGTAAGFQAVVGAKPTVTLTPANGASVLGVTNNCAAAGTNAAGDCTVTFHSDTTGTITGHASISLQIGGATITAQTNGVAPNSGDAVKAFVDANIQITPQSATNPIGTTHTLTGHVNVNAGGGAGYVNAPNGTTINFSKVSGPGTFVGPSSCTTAGGTGSCTAVITSSVPGTTVVRASTDVNVGGIVLHRETGDGKAGDSADANKLWVIAAKIAIAPSATNEVGQPHTFTVTLSKNPGQGYVPAAGETVTVALNASNGAIPNPAGPVNCITNAAGQCSVTFTSNTAGKVTGHASATLSVLGANVHVETDGTADNSGDAVKTFVDANIQITPATAVNPVSTNHTLTGHVNINTGAGGFVNAPNGTTISFSLTNAGGASASFVGPNSCTTAGGTGSCTVIINSSTTGTTTIKASTDVAVGPLTLHRESGDAKAGDSADANKQWVVAAKIAIAPSATNEIGQPHTFTATLSKNTGGGYVPAAGETITITLTPSGGAAPAPAGPINCTTNAAGQCGVTFTSGSAGKVTGHASATLALLGVNVHVETDGTVDNSGDAVKTFVDARVSIAPNATNEVGQSHTFTVTLQKNLGAGAGFVAAAGEAVTVTLAGSNGANPNPAGPFQLTTNAAGQASVAFTSQTAGLVTAHASSTLSVGGLALHRETDGTAGNSGNGLKTFVDANIQVTPASANNPVNTNHTLTGHVSVNTGAGGFVNAPNGTTITFSLTNSGGASAAFVGPNSCTTAGGTGSCTVVISSSTAGSTTIRASTNVTVGGLTLHRESGDAKAGDSADAGKLWGDATARTDILNAAGNVVTSINAGTVVHDKVFVARTAATPAAMPNPSGSVIFHRYASIDCTGTPTNQTVALTQGSPSTAISDDFAPTANISYRAEYLGDANYPARTGDCEPLAVTPAGSPSIAIVKNPKSQTVASGGTATFTITVTNTGSVTLTNVTVSDPKSPNCNRTKAQIPALASMASGASVTYTCTRPNLTASFDNIATATGTPPSGPNVSASDTAPVKVAALTPAKKTVKKKKKPKVVSHKKPKATG